MPPGRHFTLAKEYLGGRGAQGATVKQQGSGHGELTRIHFECWEFGASCQQRSTLDSGTRGSATGHWYPGFPVVHKSPGPEVNSDLPRLPAWSGSNVQSKHHVDPSQIGSTPGPRSPLVPPTSPLVPPRSPMVPPRSPMVLPRSPMVPPRSPMVPPRSPMVPPRPPMVPPRSPLVPPRLPLVPPRSPIALRIFSSRLDPTPIVATVCCVVKRSRWFRGGRRKMKSLCAVRVFSAAAGFVLLCAGILWCSEDTR